MKRLIATFILMSTSVLSSCSRQQVGAQPTEQAPVQHHEGSEAQVSVLAIEKVIGQAEATLHYSAADMCVSSDELRNPITFAAPDRRVIEFLHRGGRAVLPANDCGLGNELGRVVHRAGNAPALLVYARPYVVETENRAFVLAGWYEHTMSAQRFVFIFAKRRGDWHLQDVSKLGVV